MSLIATEVALDLELNSISHHVKGRETVGKFAYLCSYAFVLGQLLGFVILPLFNFCKQRFQPLCQCVSKALKPYDVNSSGRHSVKTCFPGLLKELHE